jgi:hypothetical protein
MGPCLAALAELRHTKFYQVRSPFFSFLVGNK